MKCKYTIWTNNNPYRQNQTQYKPETKFYITDTIRNILTIVVATICINTFESTLISIGITFSINMLLMFFREEETEN